MAAQDKSSNKSSPTLKPFLALIAGLALSLGLSMLAFQALAPQKPGPSVSAIGGPFTLQTGDGKAFSDADLRGEPFLVFFGYTHCPDVCPTTLSQISEILRALGPDAKIRVLFITVDPERDTPQLMADYAGSFDPRIVGLSGDRAAVDKVMRAYRVYARKADDKNGNYTMDHSALVYLMGRDGQFLRAFNIERPPEQAATELRPLL